MQNNFFGDFLDEVLGKSIPHKTLIDRAYVKINKHLSLKITVVYSRIVDEYDSLRLTVIDHSHGELDRMLIHFSDILSQNPKDTLSRYPYIWAYNGTEWHTTPDKNEFKRFRDVIKGVIDVYADKEE